LPLEIAHVPGHTSTGRAPGRHPEAKRATLGIGAFARIQPPGSSAGMKQASAAPGQAMIGW